MHLLKKKRVVVTGIGVLSPCGNTIEENWKRAKDGECCLIQALYPQVSFFGAVDEKYKLLLNKREKRYMDKVSHFGLLAAREAVSNSGLTKEDFSQESAIISLGSGMGGMESLAYEIGETAKNGMDKITLLGMPKLLSSMISTNISIDWGITGGTYTYNSACSSGGVAIGEAYRKIQYGECQIALAGGAESCNVEQVFASFGRLNTLSTSNDINKASIPFSKARSGFVMGEGAAILILEEYEHAVARNAKIYCEILGYGTSADAQSLVMPDLTGIKKCMSNALKDARLEHDEIEYINAHGTSTLANDLKEGKAIEEIFKDNPYVSSTKSMHGHLLGAAGALEAALCCLMIENEKLLPQINVDQEDVDEEININLLLEHPINYGGKAIMSNSFALGGDNVSLIFGKFLNR